MKLRKIWNRKLLLVFFIALVVLLYIVVRHEAYKSPPPGAFGDYLLFNGSEVLSVNIGEDRVRIRSREEPGAWPEHWGIPVLCYTTSQLFTSVGDFVGLVTLKNGEYQFQKLADGSNPSVSLDGRKLAIFERSSSVKVLELETEALEPMDIAVYPGSNLVWISQIELVFADSELNLSVANTDSGELTETGITNVLPFSLAPDGTKLLCSTLHPSNIVIYYPEENKAVTVIEDASAGLVWSLDSRGFLFTRHRLLSNPLKDAPDLYYYSVNDGNSYHLAKYFRLHAGVQFAEAR